MAGHSRPKDGVASLAYVPAIHVFGAAKKKVVDARHKAGHDVPIDQSPSRFLIVVASEDRFFVSTVTSSNLAR